ncbi:MAG TPA: peroxiredoxin [Pyrinomonadaceae bacterium]|nr:peroxiredoxin [Pyrinomonadaceae bacterium]
MNINDTAPDFTLKDGNGEDWTLSEHKGKVVVMMFYPGDDTPVCTKEMCSVRDHWSDYQATGAEVVGISTDSVESHDKFASKHDLPLRLLSDPDGKVRDLYGANSLIPGRTGRAEFVIDPTGKVTYRKVRPIGLFRPSDDEVLAEIKKAASAV